jgi:hypothetical protein
MQQHCCKSAVEAHPKPARIDMQHMVKFITQQLDNEISTTCNYIFLGAAGASCGRCSLETLNCGPKLWLEPKQ